MKKGIDHSQKMSRLWPIPPLARKEAKIIPPMGLEKKWPRSFSCWYSLQEENAVV